MKKYVILLLSALLALGGVSCSSFNSHDAIDSHGNAYSSSGFDHLRGMNPSRERDTNEVSRRFLTELPQQQPYTETGVDLKTGHTWTTYYTGNMEMYQWKSGGKKHFFVVREATNRNGANIHWEGSNPSCGYYTINRMSYIINPNAQEIAEAFTSVGESEFRTTLSRDIPNTKYTRKLGK